MALTIGSASLSDESFLAAFSTCELPLSCFRHGDHLRLAWLHLHRKSFNDALETVRLQIRRFAAFHGVQNIYHETLTRAWVTLLATHREPTFADFLAANEPRLTLDLLHRFWSADLLKSEAARTTWVPPDKSTLPV